ncbi:MAG: hypothetical protein MI919_17590, partial [Holophagales bacterium]|nr:hypothetical protein [Holophagales bacterium]
MLQASWWLGCAAAEPEAAPEPLPERMVLRLLEQDLRRTAKPAPLDPQTGIGPAPYRRMTARAVIPPNGVLGLDARITGNKRTRAIGPTVFSVRIDGEEVFRRQLETEERHVNTVADVSLLPYAGREVEIELLVDDSAARPETGFYWHRASLERYETIDRIPAGQGRNLLFVVA